MAPETLDLGAIRLRRPRESDAAAIFEYANDPDVAHYADWPLGATIVRLEAFIRERTVKWDAGEEFNWIITLATEDRAIGGISCRVEAPAATIGYLLHRAYWGRGFATIACRAIAEWALALPECDRVWATCDAENVASARVLEKAGLTRERTLPRFVVRPNISSEPRDAFLYAKVRSAS